MINAFDFASRSSAEDWPSKPAKEILQYDGFVLCDSGGYQVLQGDHCVNIKTVIALQHILEPDLAAMLDHGGNLAIHFRNFRTYMRDYDGEFMPVIPVDIPTTSLDKFADLALRSEYSTLGIGKFVPAVRPPAHYREIYKSFRRIARIRKKFPNTHLHLFGVGGVYTGLISQLFVDSIDTSSWVHDARFWKVRVVGGGVFSAFGSHSQRRKMPDDLHCQCPSCLGGQLAASVSMGLRGMKARAIHNAWVAVEEYERAKRARNEGTLFEYVRDRISKSPVHRVMLGKLAGLAHGA